MTSMEDWLSAVRADLADLTRLDFGYPLGANEVRSPSATLPRGLPVMLDELYRGFDGLNWPDVHVGYFIDTASRAASAPERGEPVVVVGETTFPVHVFGSDGGGGRFAVGLNDGAVFYLPSSGAVREGRFFEDRASRVRRTARSLPAFLGLLRDHLRAFVLGEDVRNVEAGQP